MHELKMIPLLAAVFLTACAGGVETASTATSGASTSSGGSSGSSSGSGNGGGGSGGPSGPESFVRFSEGLSWCAVRASGKVVCWEPVEGLWKTQPKDELTTILGVDDATAATVQFDAACALRASGKVACFGTNIGGAIPSVPPGATVLTPTDAPGIDALAISSVWGSMCLLRPGGQVSCFGTNPPVDVPGLTDATAISGGASGCALRASGQVACWQGFGAPLEPVSFIDDATQISVSEHYACALHASGEISCWALNDSSGALKVPGFAHAIRVNAADDEVCVIDQARDLWCWSWTWSIPAAPADLHDVWDLGSDSMGHCVIHTTGAFECGFVSGS
jgi:hypothetical protein